MKAIFVSDLHGNETKYNKLCSYIKQNITEAVFIGGDVLPNYYVTNSIEFIKDFLKPLLTDLKDDMGINYPDIYMITGNDDAAISCEYFAKLEDNGLIYFINSITVNKESYFVTGYPYIPPTPFLLKDWEKFDISRYVPRDTVSPEDGLRTVEVPKNLIKYSTIKDDLENLSHEINDFGKSIILFHTPPYDTMLDKMMGKNINGEKEIISVGSIAVRRFIEKYQPLITMHGHIHESTEITGNWQDKIGETYCYSASHSGHELAIIEFDTANPGDAKRVLV